MPKSKEDDSTLVARRTEQRAVAADRLARAEDRLTDLRQQQKTHRLLRSVAQGLYMEVDKLNKKAPAEEITKLMCDELNELIRDATGLMKSDPYVTRVKPFVAAGENPQNRDALLVLRTLLQGLDRYGPEIPKAIESNKELRGESATILAALDFWLEHKKAPDSSEIEYTKGDWFEEVRGRQYNVFSFEQLDSVDLADYLDGIVDDDATDHGVDDEEEGDEGDEDEDEDDDDD